MDFDALLLLSRERGLSQVCNLIERSMLARIGELEDRINQFEKEMEVNISKSLKEAIPECRVNMKFFLNFTQIPYFLLIRFAGVSTRRDRRYTAANKAINYVQSARVNQQSK